MELWVGWLMVGVLAAVGAGALYFMAMRTYRECDRLQYNPVKAEVVARHVTRKRSYSGEGDDYYFVYAIEVLIDGKPHQMRGNPLHTFHHYAIGDFAPLLQHRKQGYVCEDTYPSQQLERAGVVFVIAVAVLFGAIALSIFLLAHGRLPVMPPSSGGAAF